MKEIKIYEPMYDVNISYVFGGSITELKKMLKKRYGEIKLWSQDEHFTIDEMLDDDTNGYQFHVQGPFGEDERFYVWIYKPNSNLIFHETLHLVFDILSHRGIYYNNDSEEAFAYLGGMITELLDKQL